MAEAQKAQAAVPAEAAAAAAPPPPPPELVKKAQAAAAVFKRPAYWMLFFGWGLAVCAGMVNTTAFRQWGTFVSHVTGTTTNIAMRAEELHQAQTRFGPVGTNFLLVASFISGAYYSGLLIDKNAVQLNGKAMYGLALVTEAILLFVAVLSSPNLIAMCAASAACGVQNAMCTSHFGVVVRTTHVTGTATDIGSALGRTLMIYLRHGFASSKFNIVEQAEVETEGKRLIVLIPMWSCFLIGSIIGAYLETAFGIHALMVPGLITCLVGLLYINFREHLKRHLKEMQREKMAQLRQRVETLNEAVTVLEAPIDAAAPPTATGTGGALQVSPEQREEALERIVQQMAEVLEDIHELEAQQAALQEAIDLPVPREPKRANPFDKAEDPYAAPAAPPSRPSALARRGADDESRRWF